jgi:hypothetical protein
VYLLVAEVVTKQLNKHFNSIRIFKKLCHCNRNENITLHQITALLSPYSSTTATRVRKRQSITPLWQACLRSVGAVTAITSLLKEQASITASSCYRHIIIILIIIIITLMIVIILI